MSKSIETLLLKECGSKKLLIQLTMLALEIEVRKDVNYSDVLDMMNKSIKNIRHSNGGLLPTNIVDILFKECMKEYGINRDDKGKNDVCYIEYPSGLYVIYNKPGDYMLTPDKSTASKFPSLRAAERFMRELWIDGKIV